MTSNPPPQSSPHSSPRHSPQPSMSLPHAELTLAQLQGQLALLAQQSQSAHDATQLRLQSVEQHAAHAQGAAVHHVLPPRTSKLKIAGPPQFKGEMGIQLDEWVRSMELQFKYYGETHFPDDTSRINMAEVHLVGPAAQWWENELKPILPAVMSWNDFVDRLQKRFRPLKAAMLARTKLAELHQRAGQGVNAYAHAFQMTLASIVDMSPADQVHNFTKGLHPHIFTRVFEKQPTTLVEAIELAVSIEAISKYGRIATPSNYSHGGRSKTSSHAASSHAPMDLNHIGSDRKEETDQEEDSTSSHLHENSSTQVQQGDSVVQKMMAKMQALEHRLAALSSNSSSKTTRKSNSKDRVPGLTADDIYRLRKEGRCFRCKQLGHMKDSCPQKPKNE
jgi:hypothetical protein